MSENVSSRKTCKEVPYQGGSGGTLFSYTSCKKSSKRVPKKGPWTGRYHSLTFLRAVHFWILENQELKLPVDSSREAALRPSRQKSIIFLTDGHQIRMCSTDGKSASRNNSSLRWAHTVTLYKQRLFIILFGDVISVSLVSFTENDFAIFNTLFFALRPNLLITKYGTLLPSKN